MIFENRLKPYLNELAIDLIKKEFYEYLPDIVNLLNAFKSKQWNKLPVDEQIHWLKNLCSIIAGRNGFIDFFGFDNKNINSILEIAQAQIKALERKI